MNVSNGNVIDEFRHDKHDTTRFVFLCTRLWIISNINSPEAGDHLNDPDRNKFEFKTDQRLDFLLKTVSAIKLMDSRKRGAWMMGLTDYTANAFHQNLNATVYIIKKNIRCRIWLRSPRQYSVWLFRGRVWYLPLFIWWQ